MVTEFLRARMHAFKATTNNMFIKPQQLKSHVLDTCNERTAHLPQMKY